MLAKSIAILIVCTLPCTSFSQIDSTQLLRPASQHEIVGDWQLAPFPDALQPKVLRANPWPSECQWFAYQKDGVFKSLSRITAPCPPLTAAVMDAPPFASPPNLPDISWKHEAAAASGEGYIIISRSDNKGYREKWQVDIVQNSFQKGDINFLQGDLILSLVDPKSSRALWYRHLRHLD
ncbi:hypothetical protein [Paraburkholderia diazotrophica]|uniref:Lipocalin-like domain-containing protein n=1 Tax=Paraburkholderia diazotrophica TaxID=667676 RepID=A0A1H7EI03_9BURK|nr:hypothetical protein [Paraburkholderia diazotrophica]SEK13254.1 hypothetical protein SAMN05192539_106513 [Paraburkholderia diazotrophica]